MNRPHSFALILATLALTFAGSFACARPHDDDGRDHRGRDERMEQPRTRISMDQAVAMAEKRYNARVVRADSRESDGRIIYVLRLLNDSGRVWTVKVDASSGEMR